MFLENLEKNVIIVYAPNDWDESTIRNFWLDMGKLIGKVDIDVTSLIGKTLRVAFFGTYHVIDEKMISTIPTTISKWVFEYE